MLDVVKWKNRLILSRYEEDPPSPPLRYWRLLGMQATTDNLNQLTLYYIPKEQLPTLSSWKSMASYMDHGMDLRSP